MCDEGMESSAPRKQQTYGAPAKRAVQRNARTPRVFDLRNQRFPKLRMCINLLHIEGDRLPCFLGKLAQCGL